MFIKILTTLLLAVTLSKSVFSQYDEHLCKQNEEIVFAFQLYNKKWVSVCQYKQEKYIVYRFGTQKRIELEFPSALDSTSWQQFSFKGYNRGGGKQNAAMYYGFLSFVNNGTNYEIYDTWNSEDNLKHCGITIVSNGKTSDLEGIVKTRKEELLSLLFNDKIKQQEE